MTVRAITASGDWTFGKGKANYIKDNAEIKQNVVTRLKSFKNDWFLDMDAEIDWFGLLGSKQNKEKIEREIERVVLATDGVLRITKLELIQDRVNRDATINLDISTTFSTEIFVTTEVL